MLREDRFGRAGFPTGLDPSRPRSETTGVITAMTASVDGYGYYMTSANGAVYAFGDAPYLGRPYPTDHPGSSRPPSLHPERD